MTNTTHPWTNYEVARLRDEERLLRARAAMRALEVREQRVGERRVRDPGRTTSLIDRVRRRPATEPATGRSAVRHARRRVAYR